MKKQLSQCNEFIDHMEANDDAAGWADQALETLSEPEQATKAEVGLAVTRIEEAFRSHGSNPAPDEYETLRAELKHSNPDIGRCRRSLKAIREHFVK